MVLVELILFLGQEIDFSVSVDVFDNAKDYEKVPMTRVHVMVKKVKQVPDGV